MGDIGSEGRSTPWVRAAPGRAPRRSSARRGRRRTSREGLNVHGAATWGQFFIYQGFNAHTGWMHTTSGVDNIDEFAETIVTAADGTRSYRYGDELRPVTTKTITLSFRTEDGGQEKRDFTTFATHQGPVVREAHGKWIACALMNKPVEALQQSFLRTTTGSYADYLRVAGLKANSSNNTLFADSKGEIAFLMPQFMPRRAGRFDYLKPVHGSDPATDWHGLHSLDSMPHVVNPKSGWAFNSSRRRPGARCTSTRQTSRATSSGGTGRASELPPHAMPLTGTGHGARDARSRHWAASTDRCAASSWRCRRRRDRGISRNMAAPHSISAAGPYDPLAMFSDAISTHRAINTTRIQMYGLLFCCSTALR
ncbi:penicillin acylase family protein [Streptomyces sp. NPDC050264]|uniref:penicillin acylase family protein n=1 Tax=Streptomyces sp. NPDC050264 TaxID=3155038 RepID=UPI0034206B28